MRMGLEAIYQTSTPHPPLICRGFDRPNQVWCADSPTSRQHLIAIMDWADVLSWRLSNTIRQVLY